MCADEAEEELGPKREATSSSKGREGTREEGRGEGGDEASKKEESSERNASDTVVWACIGDDCRAQMNDFSKHVHNINTKSQ